MWRFRGKDGSKLSIDRVVMATRLEQESERQDWRILSLADGCGLLDADFIYDNPRPVTLLSPRVAPAAPGRATSNASRPLATPTKGPAPVMAL